jgi:hypothetical protein
MSVRRITAFLAGAALVAAGRQSDIPPVVRRATQAT